MHNLFKNKRGYTFIELLIVIFIIGILAVILLPGAYQTINAAKKVGVQTRFEKLINNLDIDNAGTNNSLDFISGLQKYIAEPEIQKGDMMIFAVYRIDASSGKIKASFYMCNE